MTAKVNQATGNLFLDYPLDALQTPVGPLGISLAYNHQLGDAVQQWAFCSLRGSPWARAFYDGKRATGKSHHAALRALGNRWLEILWHCLQRNAFYDETIHAANRDHTLTPLVKAA